MICFPLRSQKADSRIPSILQIEFRPRNYHPGDFKILGISRSSNKQMALAKVFSSFLLFYLIDIFTVFYYPVLLPNILSLSHSTISTEENLLSCLSGLYFPLHFWQPCYMRICYSVLPLSNLRTMFASPIAETFIFWFYNSCISITPMLCSHKICLWINIFRMVSFHPHLP